MLRKFFRKFLPDAESIKHNRYIRFFGSPLQHPNLWHLNRRSVAGGVAVGLFTGLIPGSNPVQFTAAVILSMIFRVNLPVALFVTFTPIRSPLFRCIISPTSLEHFSSDRITAICRSTN